MIKTLSKMNVLLGLLKWNHRLRIQPLSAPLQASLSMIPIHSTTLYHNSNFESLPKRFSSTYDYGYKRKRSHYELLGIKPTATTKEIRAAFLKLSKEYHPDKNANDPSQHTKFVEINEAYTVLSKALTRRDYDAVLNAERYMHRQMSGSAARSHGYGYSPEPGAQHHYNQETYHGMQYHDYDPKEEEGIKKLMTSYVTSVVITLIITGLVLKYMFSVVDDSPWPDDDGLRKFWTQNELNKLELIMSAEQNGETIYYYAVPKTDDPSKREVMAVVKKCVNEKTDEWEIQELYTR